MRTGLLLWFMPVLGADIGMCFPIEQIDLCECASAAKRLEGDGSAPPLLALYAVKRLVIKERNITKLIKMYQFGAPEGKLFLVTA